MAGSAAPGNGPAAGAPRLLGPGAVRGPAGEGKVAAGAMEGVLYKWTNYLSGEWEACQDSGPLSEPREGGVGTRLQGVGVMVPPETRERGLRGPGMFPHSSYMSPVLYRHSPP